jgi:hypothetical protein
MSHKKTIGMLVLAVSAVITAAALVLPSMTMVAQGEQCASSASSVDGSASTSADAFVLEQEGVMLDECDTDAHADPPED